MGDTLQDMWAAALTINANPSLNQPRTESTVPTDALQSMQPLTQSQPGGTWGDFWGGVQGALQAGLQYAIAKDAAKSGLASDGAGGYVPMPTGGVAQPGTGQAPAQGGGMSNGTMLMLGLGAVALVGLVLLVKD